MVSYISAGFRECIVRVARAPKLQKWTASLLFEAAAWHPVQIKRGVCRRASGGSTSPSGQVGRILTKLGTYDGVAEAGHPLNAALMIARAVWDFAGATLAAAPENAALTRSLLDLTGVREMGQGKSGVSPRLKRRSRHGHSAIDTIDPIADRAA